MNKNPMKLLYMLLLVALCGCTQSAQQKGVSGATLVVYVTNPDGTPNKDANVAIYDAAPKGDRSNRDIERRSTRDSQYGVVSLGPVWLMNTELVIECQGFKTVYMPVILHPGENSLVIKLQRFEAPPRGVQGLDQKAEA
jgi:hypothetical protein